ncbi:MAG: AAA family ATPase [Planctomycetaceae bacterium]
MTKGGRLKQLVKTLAPIVTDVPTSYAGNGHRSQEREAVRLASSPIVQSFADIEPRAVSWLWPGRIAAGRISLLVGQPGIGKSFVTCDIASRVSTGTPWPDGSQCFKGSVLFITCEDDPHDTIRPRLDAHGADVSNVHVLRGVRHEHEGGEVRETMFTLADVQTLEMALEKITDCKLVIIDPIGSYIGGSTDSYKDSAVRAVLAPVARVAEQFGPAVLVVAHRRKSAGGSADDSALGSKAFVGLARSVWHLNRDADNRHRRLLLPGKNNLSAEVSGLAFSIGGEPASVSWEREPIEMSADDAMQMEVGDGGQSDVKDAVAWLNAILADGPIRVPEVKRRAREDGIDDKALQHAKKRLNVTHGPETFGGPWVWKLPVSSVSSVSTGSQKTDETGETERLWKDINDAFPA